MKKKPRDIRIPFQTAGLVQRFFWLVFPRSRHSAYCQLPTANCLLPTAYCLLLLLSLASTALAEVSLKVTTTRPKIYLGETFNLTVEVNGADREAEPPDLSALPPAENQLLGSHSNSRSSISIINGRMTRESFEGRVFAYQIKPVSEGAFKAGPVRVKVAGKTYTHPGVTVQVAGVEKQDTVIARVTASSTSVLVEEPFSVTLSVAVAELPDPYAEKNEPIHPSHLPQLSADFLEIRQSDPGLKAPDLNQILNGIIDQSGRQPSFAINSYQTRDMGFGSLFDSDPFRPRPIRFRLTPNRITINGKKYREYTLSLNYTPTKEGDFTFGPVSFKGTVIADVTADRQAVTKDIYAIGPAVTVRVVPPPDEGRPDWFVGSVGKALKAAAAFDATTCKVGDPLTLTLELTGQISVSNLRTPILNLQPELAKDFRIYDDNVTADTLPDGKRFKYRVRPTREGTLEFPPIKIAYYDTAAKAYATVTTAPIPIQARATTQIATAGEAGEDVPQASEQRPIPAGISLIPLGESAAALLPPPPLTRLLLAAGPLLCLLAVMAAPLARGLRALRARRRRSGALHRALGALRHAASADLAARAVRTYLAERLDVPGSALTPAETEALLLQRRMAPDAAARCRTQLAQLDEAMYRPDSSAPLADTVRALQDLLPRLDAAFDAPVEAEEKNPSDLSAGSARSVLFFLFLLPALSARSDDATRAFLWEQANAQAANAAKPEDHVKAADTYNRLVRDGVRSGQLFANLGSTLIMAGDGANAAAAFARAERYQGATPETRQGLAAALALQAGRQQADLPWSRTAFFWHFALPCQTRALAALGGWCLFWLGVFCHILVRSRSPHSPGRSLSDTCMLTGGLIAVIFSASTVMTLAQERHDAATWDSRVFLSSSPSEKEVEQ